MDKITLTLTLSLEDAQRLIQFVDGKTDAKPADPTEQAAPPRRKKAAKKKAAKKPAPEPEPEPEAVDLQVIQTAVKKSLDTIGTEATREVFQQFSIKKISQLDEEQWQEFYDALIEAREMAE